MKPPYGRITAYNMNKGEIAWQIPNGDTPPAVKNNPALKGLTIPKTGSPSQAGLLVTKTLLFAGEGAGGQAFFHAYDKATGAEIWQTRDPWSADEPADDLPAPGPAVRCRRRAWTDRIGRAADGVCAAARGACRPGGGRGGRAVDQPDGVAERRRRTKRLPTPHGPTRQTVSVFGNGSWRLRS